MRSHACGVTCFCGLVKYLGRLLGSSRPVRIWGEEAGYGEKVAEAEVVTHNQERALGQRPSSESGRGAHAWLGQLVVEGVFWQL